MKTEDLQAFLWIIDGGSLSEASRRHGTAKASLSHRLQRIEAELGAALFHRRGARMELTEPGIALLPHARAVVRVLEQAADAVAERSRTDRQHLRIGTTDELGTNLVGPLALAFARDHPALSLELLVLPAAGLFHADNGIDCAFLAGDPPQPAAADQIARRFAHYVARLYAAPGYLAAAGTPTKPEDISHHALVVGAGRTGSTEWSLTDGRRRVTIHAQGRLGSNDSWLAKLCIVQGEGIGFLPDFFVAEEIKVGALVPVLPEWTSDRRALMLLHPAHRIANPLIKALRRFVLRRFDGYYSFPYRREDRIARPMPEPPGLQSQ